MTIITCTVGSRFTGTIHFLRYRKLTILNPDIPGPLDLLWYRSHLKLRYQLFPFHPDRGLHSPLTCSLSVSSHTGPKARCELTRARRASVSLVLMRQTA
eukprot:sb/3478747/